MLRRKAWKTIRPGSSIGLLRANPSQRASTVRPAALGGPSWARRRRQDHLGVEARRHELALQEGRDRRRGSREPSSAHQRADCASSRPPNAVPASLQERDRASPAPSLVSRPLADCANPGHLSRPPARPPRRLTGPRGSPPDRRPGAFVCVRPRARAFRPPGARIVSRRRPWPPCGRPVSRAWMPLVPSIGRQDAGIAQMLGGAGLLDEAHAAMDLHAVDGDSLPGSGELKHLHDRIRRSTRSCVLRAVSLSGCLSAPSMPAAV